jgi:hypothetical protein
LLPASGDARGALDDNTAAKVPRVALPLHLLRLARSVEHGAVEDLTDTPLGGIALVDPLTAWALGRDAQAAAVEVAVCQC